MYETETKYAKKYNIKADDKLTTDAVALKIALFYKYRGYSKFSDNEDVAYQIKPRRELFKKGDFYFPDAQGNFSLVEFAKKSYLDTCDRKLRTIDIEVRKLTEQSLWIELYMYSPSCDLAILIPRQVITNYGSKPFTKSTFNKATGERTEGEYFIGVPIEKLFFIPLNVSIEEMKIYDYNTIKQILNKAIFGNERNTVQTSSFIPAQVKA